MISQQAINFLTDDVWNNSPQIYTPENLRPKEDATATNLEHLAMPMVHPTTGSRKPATKGRRNRYQFRTLGDAHGSSYNGRNNIELQKIDEQPCHDGNMANSIWKRFWRHGTRR